MSKLNKLVRTVVEKGYYVIEDGTVFSYTGKERKLRRNGKGYLVFNVRNEQKEAMPVPVHRLVAYQLFGEKAMQSGIQTRHLNGDQLDNRFTNIAIGTQSDNLLDRSREDRVTHAKKASAVQKKLSDEEVAQLRKDRESGASYKELCEIYGLAKSTISYIVNGKTYV